MAAWPVPVVFATHLPIVHNAAGSISENDFSMFIVRFLLIIGVLAGAVFGAMWALASFPPERTEIVKPISHEALRN
ncbi:MAG TPA: hypothetical protein VMN43_10285 [Aestuariivirgaceae bacterium]|nr:hypothetical protein [Aestuariivirgaceae bacterium]